MLQRFRAFNREGVNNMQITKVEQAIPAVLVTKPA